MASKNLTLYSNQYPNGVTTRSDLFNPRQTVTSRERSRRIGKPKQVQTPMEMRSECRFCNTDLLDQKPIIEECCNGRVGTFENAAPYLPFDPRVLFVKNQDQDVTKKALHICRLPQIRKFDLFYTLSAMVECGKRFADQPVRHTDLLRMFCGYNIGPMAGQTMPHIHSQYGWEVVLEHKDITETEGELFYEELRKEDLILDESDPKKDPVQYKLIAAWTPRGQYHIAIHFTKAYEIHKMSVPEMKIFAYLGHAIIQKYYDLGICNLNIVFNSSPQFRMIEPVIIDFIPCVNTTAMYERHGSDVVDTPPSMTFNTFVNMPFRAMKSEYNAYDPEAEYEAIVMEARTDIVAGKTNDTDDINDERIMHQEELDRRRAYEKTRKKRLAEMAKLAVSASLSLSAPKP